MALAQLVLCSLGGLSIGGHIYLTLQITCVCGVVAAYKYLDMYPLANNVNGVRGIVRPLGTM
jgi:hypothetical protein